jgi:hypothetical protein
MTADDTVAKLAVVGWACDLTPEGYALLNPLRAYAKRPHFNLEIKIAVLVPEDVLEKVVSNVCTKICDCRKAYCPLRYET